MPFPVSIQTLFASLPNKESVSPPPSTVIEPIATAVPNLKAFDESPPVNAARSNPVSVNVVEPTTSVEPISVKFVSAVTAILSSPAPTNVIAFEPAKASVDVSSRSTSAPIVPVTRTPPVAAADKSAWETTALLLAVSSSWNF